MKKFAVLSLILFFTVSLGTIGSAQVSLQVSVAPPPIEVSAQPPCPGDGYIWTPGYWAYGPNGWYWVPGVWAWPTEVGFLWTPGYWGFYDGFYHWHRGYWGPHVGYYGGINYGFGYGGSGYYGGRWEGGHFRYNTAISNINSAKVHYVYSDRTVINNNAGGRASYHTVARPAQPIRQQTAPQHSVQPIRQQTAPQHSVQPIRQQTAPQRSAQPIRQQTTPQRSVQRAPAMHESPGENRGGGGGHEHR